MLINCKDCQNEYSDNAKECPKCGCPTANNTIAKKRKNMKECSVKIKGNEKYHPPISLRGWAIMLTYAFIGFSLWEYGTDTSKGYAMLLFFFSVFMPFITPWIVTKISGGYKKDKQHRKIINEYFQDRFPIIDALPARYDKNKVVNIKQDDQKSLMFDIYMQAYKFDADAIVLNDTNVTNYNTNKFNATATLIKY